MTIEIKEFKNNKEFAKKFDMLVKRETTLRQSYHEFATSALAHYKEHGDSGRLATMINLMNKRSHYRQEMFDWIKEFAPLRTEKVDDDDIKFINRTDTDMKHGDVDVEKAFKQPFWMINGDKSKLKELDVIGQIKALLKRARDKAAMEAGDEGVENISKITTMDTATLDQIETIVTTSKPVVIDFTEARKAAA